MNEKSSFIIFDGQLYPAKKPVIPVTSRGLMYGDGCFETCCCFDGRFFQFQQHMARLKQGLEFLEIDYPAVLEPGNIIPAIHALLRKNNLEEQKCVVRIQAWREGQRGYTTDSATGHYSICITPPPLKVSSRKLATVPIRRMPSMALPSGYKFTNGINYITAAKQARRQQADDALMQTTAGYIAETTIANVFWWHEGRVYTPSKACDILPGITREALIHIIKNVLAVPIKEGAFSEEEIKAAQAVWVCNSVRGIVAVSQIDEVHFDARHPFIITLQARFESYINEQLAGGE